MWYTFPRGKRGRREERTGLLGMGLGVGSREKRGRQTAQKSGSGGID